MTALLSAFPAPVDEDRATGGQLGGVQAAVRPMRFVRGAGGGGGQDFFTAPPRSNLAVPYRVISRQ